MSKEELERLEREKYVVERKQWISVSIVSLAKRTEM